MQQHKFIINFNNLNMFRAIISSTLRYAGAYGPAYQFQLILVTSRQHRRCIIPQAVNTV